MLKLIIDLKQVKNNQASAEAEFPMPANIFSGSLPEIFEALPSKANEDEESTAELFKRLVKALCPMAVTPEGQLSAKKYAGMLVQINNAIENGEATDEEWNALTAFSQVLFQLEQLTNPDFKPEVVTTTLEDGTTTTGATWESIITEIARMLAEDETPATAPQAGSPEVKQELSAMSTPTGEITGNSFEAMKALASAMVAQNGTTTQISTAAAELLATASNLSQQAISLLGAVNKAQEASNAVWQSFGSLLETAAPTLPATTEVPAIPPVPAQ